MQVPAEQPAGGAPGALWLCRPPLPGHSAALGVGGGGKLWEPGRQLERGAEGAGLSSFPAGLLYRMDAGLGLSRRTVHPPGPQVSWDCDLPQNSLCPMTAQQHEGRQGLGLGLLLMLGSTRWLLEVATRLLQSTVAGFEERVLHRAGQSCAMFCDQAGKSFCPSPAPDTHPHSQGRRQPCLLDGRVLLWPKGQ